jgi:hypothetical protein
MKKELDFTETQALEIEKKAKAIQAEFEKDLAELRRKYRKKLDASLTSKQREKLRKLLGKESPLPVRSIDF